LTSLRPWSGRVLLLIAIAALALNLRPPALAIAPVLPEIRADLGFGGVLAGVLTTLPPLCFAVHGLLAPVITSRVGLHRAALFSLLAIAIGQAVRILIPQPAVFFGATGLALTGMATGNVLLPPLVRRDFPDRIGRVTGVYSLSLGIGVRLATYDLHRCWPGRSVRRTDADHYKRAGSPIGLLGATSRCHRWATAVAYGPYTRLRSARVPRALIAPTTLPWLWAMLLAVDLASFPAFLALTGLRGETPAGTAALSGFSQSVGPFLAAIGPFAMGVLSEATGGWTVPLIFLSALCIPLAVFGQLAVRPNSLESELRSRQLIQPRQP
jgi:cyanate permease